VKNPNLCVSVYTYLRTPRMAPAYPYAYTRIYLCVWADEQVMWAW
jgi:hypothetical protein